MDSVNRIIGRKGKGKAQHSKTRTFPLRVLKQATNKFDKKQVIGHGGFGKVYMGELKDGTKVAVKQREPNSEQGEKEFQMEIELLAGLEHPNLVSLIGHCKEKNEMILVYEYMEKGTLKSHLYGSNKPPLSWTKRLEVCVGAAKGLQYLHTTKSIIHRDVKSGNILLDEDLCAKVGDFGISKHGPELDQTHVTTQVKGTPGYYDPEYFQTQKLTKKSDVYSFGVVLLEVLCARRVTNPSPEEESLVCWGKKMLEEGRVEEIIDPTILHSIHPYNRVRFGDIVLSCLKEKGVTRPTMEQVLKDLEQELEDVRANPANPDESVHDSIRVAAGNSGESGFGHAVVSSQPIRQEKTLKRLEGKAFERSSQVSVSHDLSAPSMSHVVRLSRSPPVLGGSPMKMNGLLDKLIESIGEDEESQ